MAVPISRLHHVGIVVEDLDRALQGYKVLGLEPSSIEDYPDYELRIAFIPVGETLVELIMPLGTTGMNAEFLRDHGEGLHHIAFQTEPIEGAIETVRCAGMPVMHGEPVPGAGNTRIAFINAESFGGALIEFVEPIKEGH